MQRNSNREDTFNVSNERIINRRNNTVNLMGLLVKIGPFDWANLTIELNIQTNIHD
jgi:hypothetical protein